MDTESTTVVENTANRTTQAMNRTVEGMKKAADAAAAQMRESQAVLTGSVERAMQTGRAVLAFQRGSLDIAVHAGEIYVQGVRTIGAGIAQAAQKQFDETLAAFRALANVKTVREALALQGNLTRTGASRLLTEGAAVVDQSAKLATEVLAPLTARARVAAEKIAAEKIAA